MAPVDPDQLKARFDELGYFFPLRVMSEARAADYRARLDALDNEIRQRKLGHGTQLNQMHLVACFANEIVRNPLVLDAVEAIIGPDILVWGSTFFIKPARSPGYVSWHQDLTYWGLEDPSAMVSAWLALVPVTRANGAMRFVPGSQKSGLAPHDDLFDTDNVLYRGQRARVDIDEDAVVHVELEPGEISLHHGHLLHASAPNPSAEARIGYTMNFVAPHNRQSVAPVDYAMLVRGEDRYGHFEPVPAPDSDLSDAAMEWHARVLAAQDLASFDGVARPAR